MRRMQCESTAVEYAPDLIGAHMSTRSIENLGMAAVVSVIICPLTSVKDRSHSIEMD